MNSPSSKRKVSNDKEKVYKARKQVIVCESIIRKVLAIQNCFAELNSHIKDNDINKPVTEMAGTQNSSPKRGQVINDGNIVRKNIPRITIPDIQQEHSYILVDNQPTIDSVSPNNINDMSVMRSTSQHVPTPIPNRTICSTTSPSSLKRSSSVYDQCKTPVVSQIDICDQFSEESFHTPPRKRRNDNNLYTSSSRFVEKTSYVETNQSGRHIKWRDKSNQESLIQTTPPPSRPLHRETLPLKPCVESPDLLTKKRLEEQRYAMLEKQRQFYVDQLGKHNCLF